MRPDSAADQASVVEAVLAGMVQCICGVWGYPFDEPKDSYWDGDKMFNVRVANEERWRCYFPCDICEDLVDGEHSFLCRSTGRHLRTSSLP